MRDFEEDGADEGELSVSAPKTWATGAPAVVHALQYALGQTSPKRTALNPRTGEKVAVKAGATVKFKASPSLKESALAGLKKAKRKAKKG